MGISRDLSLRPNRHPTEALAGPACRGVRTDRLAYPSRLRGGRSRVLSTTAEKWTSSDEPKRRKWVTIQASPTAFEAEYVVCRPCAIGWVESPVSYPGYKRLGLASAALRSLRHQYPGLEWHTGGGHFRESEPFWISVGADVPGGYTQQERCHHVEPRRVKRT